MTTMRVNHFVSGLAATWLGALLMAAAPGCQSRPSGPYAWLGEASRDSLKAQSLTQDAAAILHDNPSKAEKLLREALAADLFHGPAHNNLGVIYLARGQLYEAAGEFEWARKLMPGNPDPRVNLAITLERAGKVDDALAAYTSALETQQGYLPAMQGLASLQLRAGRADHRTPELLDAIALRGDSERWRNWAREQQLSAPATR